MMAGPQLQLHMPAAVGMPFHRRGLGMPVIEIPDQRDVPGRGDGANEIDRLDGLKSGQTRRGAKTGL
jgi:hypothetical protein